MSKEEICSKETEEEKTENKTKSKPTTTTRRNHPTTTTKKTTKNQSSSSTKTGIQGVEVGAIVAPLLQTEVRTERHPLELAAW